METDNTDLIRQQVRHIGHEIRNQLSICDIYSEIIKKHLAKSNIKNSSIDNAINCIQNAVKLIGNSLVDLKCVTNIVSRVCVSDKLLDECVNMSKVYILDKKIDITTSFVRDVKIFVDENKFQGCIINIIKNAIEAIDNNGFVNIASIVENGFLLVKISNNGRAIPVEMQKEIFDDGFTTKKTGSGIGLYLCKNNLEAMDSSLKLIQSTNEITEFEIKLPIMS